MAKKKGLGKANDVGVPEDEITLAQLIQNAAARGLTSTQGDLYRKDGRHVVLKDTAYEYETYEDKYFPEDCGNENPAPAGKVRKVDADCACAIGAQLLTPKIDRPLSFIAISGNDAHDDVALAYGDERSLNIGAAYEQALRPEGK